jgi:hypothetical protein
MQKRPIARPGALPTLRSRQVLRVRLLGYMRNNRAAKAEADLADAWAQNRVMLAELSATAAREPVKNGEAGAESVERELTAAREDADAVAVSNARRLAATVDVNLIAAQREAEALRAASAPA